MLTVLLVLLVHHIMCKIHTINKFHDKIEILIIIVCLEVPHDAWMITML